MLVAPIPTVPTYALMKKGLRLSFGACCTHTNGSNLCPDEEGIETFLLSLLWSSFVVPTYALMKKGLRQPVTSLAGELFKFQPMP